MRPREQLQMVVRRADELSQTSCLAHAGQWGFTFNYTKDVGAKWIVRGPNSEEVDVLVRRLRPFLLEKEPTHLGKVHNLCQQVIRSDQLRGWLIDARAVWKDFQRRGFFQLEIDGRNYTPERVMYLFINGWLFHSDNEDNVRELARLRTGFGEPISQQMFHDYLLEATRQATYVGAVVRQALANDLIDDDPKQAAA